MSPYSTWKIRTTCDIIFYCVKLPGDLPFRNQKFEINLNVVSYKAGHQLSTTALPQLNFYNDLLYIVCEIYRQLHIYLLRAIILTPKEKSSSINCQKATLPLVDFALDHKVTLVFRNTHTCAHSRSRTHTHTRTRNIFNKKKLSLSMSTINCYTEAAPNLSESLPLGLICN